jgi:ADP-ribose pyrophosphatase
VSPQLVERRSWAVDWPDYTPTPVTTPDWVADTDVADPTEVGWPLRQAAALIAYTVVGGRPRRPLGRTGRTGRPLALWGENAAADAAVVAGPDHDRRLLLIRRGDTGQWALPGGGVDPGETATVAMGRELWEETGLVPDTAPLVLGTWAVDDPRDTDESWLVTTVGLYRLPEPAPVRGGDDAVDARWWPFPDPEALIAALAADGGLYPAHRALVEQVYRRL